MWWIIISTYIVIGLFVSGICVNTFWEGKTPSDKLNDAAKDDGGIFLISALIFLWPITAFAIVFFLTVCLTKNTGIKLRNFLDRNDL